MMRHFGALLWKEWRGLRALFIGLAIGGPVFLLAAWAYPGYGPDRGDSVATAAALFLVLAAAALPASVIAGERQTGTLAFLVDLPVARWKVVAVKVVVAGVLWLALVALASGVGRLCARTAWVMVWRPSVLGAAAQRFGLAVWDRSWWEFGLSSLRLALLFSCCFLLSAGLGRPLVALLLGVPLACAVLLASLLAYPFYLSEWPYVLDEWQRRITATETSALTTLAPALKGFVALWPLAMGWYVFARVRDGAGLRRRAAAIGKALGITALVFAVPHVIGFLAKQARFAALKPADAGRMRWLLPSPPDGRWLAFEPQFSTVPFGGWTERGAVLDLATGRAELVTRFRSSRNAHRSWSPDGRYLVYSTRKDWLADLAAPVRRSFGLADFSNQVVGLFDVATGRRWEIPDPQAGGGWFRGWETPTSLILQKWTGPRLGFHRYDVEKRTLEPLRLPDAAVDPRPGWASPWWARTMHGRPYFLGKATDGSPQIALYDAASRAWMAHPLPDGWEIEDMSADHRLLVAVARLTEDSASPRQVILYNWSDGSTRVMDTVRPSRYYGIACLLSPRGDLLLVRAAPEARQGMREASLYELRTGRRTRLPQPNGGASCSVAFTADDARLVWLCPSAYHAKEDAGRARFYVHDLRTADLRALPIRQRSMRRWDVNAAAVAQGGIVFTCGGRAIYRIGLDGTGLERVFPRREPLTLEAFKAETPATEPGPIW